MPGPLNGRVDERDVRAAVSHFVERLVKRLHDETELRQVKDNLEKTDTRYIY